MVSKAKMGRPVKAPEDRQTNILRICLTDAEREVLDEAAGSQTSTWARETLLRAAKRRIAGA